MPDPGLSLCWSELSRGRGEYRFALLRETPLDPLPTADRVGDIDLLGTRGARRALIRAAFDLAKSGFCHLRVRRSSPAKTRLSICAIDFSTSIELDVWEDLRQLDGGRRSLRFADVEHLLLPPPDDRDRTAAIQQRLPIDLEAAIYVQHLEVKRKDLLDASVVRRLRFYAAATRATNDQLANAIQTVLDRGELDGATRRVAAEVIERHVPVRPLIQSIRGLRSRFARLTYRRRRAERAAAAAGRAAFVIGCDGAGKTSVARTLAEAPEFQIEYVVGKQLYRRSLLFRGAYKVNKATINLPSERVDEWLNVAAFIAASCRLACALAAPADPDEPKRFLVIDRSPADFVYVGRKTSSPRFSWLSRLLPTRRLSSRLPVIHFVVDHATLASRKAEVPPRGHRRYDLDMLQWFVDSGPVDYLALSNAGRQAQALAALRHHLANLGAPSLSSSVALDNGDSCGTAAPGCKAVERITAGGGFATVNTTC